MQIIISSQVCYLSLFMLSNFACLVFVVCWFKKNSFWNIIRVSNGLDPLWIIIYIHILCMRSAKALVTSDMPPMSLPTDDISTEYHVLMGESSKFPKSRTLENQNLKLAVCLQNIKNFKLNGQLPLDKLKLNQKSYY